MENNIIPSEDITNKERASLKLIHKKAEASYTEKNLTLNDLESFE